MEVIYITWAGPSDTNPVEYRQRQLDLMKSGYASLVLGQLEIRAATWASLVTGLHSCYRESVTKEGFATRLQKMGASAASAMSAAEAFNGLD